MDLLLNTFTNLLVVINVIVVIETEVVIVFKVFIHKTPTIYNLNNVYREFRYVKNAFWTNKHEIQTPIGEK